MLPDGSPGGHSNNNTANLEKISMVSHCSAELSAMVPGGRGFCDSNACCHADSEADPYTGESAGEDVPQVQRVQVTQPGKSVHDRLHAHVNTSATREDIG